MPFKTLFAEERNHKLTDMRLGSVLLEFRILVSFIFLLCELIEKGSSLSSNRDAGSSTVVYCPAVSCGVIKPRGG